MAHILRTLIRGVQSSKLSLLASSQTLGAASSASAAGSCWLPALSIGVAHRTYAGLPLSTGRPRLVVLGTGWAAARVARDVDPKAWDITIVSPRNHFVFTPLLASTCVGTLEPRSVAVPVIGIQPALKQPQNYYFASHAVSIDHKKQQVHCKDEMGKEFDVAYDKLLVATGSQGSTFGIPGVEKYTYPLRDVANATAIRNRLIWNWNEANLPSRTTEERLRLLSVVIVGGGPTGVEFAGEITDFIRSDLRRIDAERARDMRVTVIEAAQVLGSFDHTMREYAARKLHDEGVHLIKGVVKEVKESEVVLNNGDKMAYGLCVWSTGVGPTNFTTSTPFAKTAKGRIAIDNCLRVLCHPPDASPEHPTKPGDFRMEDHDKQSKFTNKELHVVPGVYAAGDCCANVENPLPALAQVAEQQGKYLARHLNAMVKQGKEDCEPFQYHQMGMLATVGTGKGILQLGKDGADKPWLRWSGFRAWFAWRSAYLTRLGRMQNRIYVMMNWTMALLFGRDMTRW